MQAQQILTFWFDELNPSQWWKKDESLDQTVRARFADLHQAASRGELFAWRATPNGRLAEVIVLDQFSRNMYRGKTESFSQDGMALVLAQEAVANGMAQALSHIERCFLYMPYMHSESLRIHEQAVALFALPGLEDNLRFELRHKAIIERFGRYPHRNEILGRPSSEEEIEFLNQPSSRF